jgi:hypothetical protein
MIRVFIRSFGCPRQPRVGAERPTDSAEVARGDPPLLPDFSPNDQIKVTHCCVMIHSMISSGLSMLYYVHSHRGGIDSVMSGAFPRHFLLRSGTRQRAPTFSGLKKHSQRVHTYVRSRDKCLQHHIQFSWGKSAPEPSGPAYSERVRWSTASCCPLLSFPRHRRLTQAT